MKSVNEEFRDASSEFENNILDDTLKIEETVTIEKDIIKKNKGRSKPDYWISPEDAVNFEYEDSMQIGEIKEKLNNLRDKTKSKRVTSKSIMEYLTNMGYMSEKFVDGVWVKLISDEGQRQGLQYIKCESKHGFEYVVIGISRQVQRMIVDHFVRN